jgi:hypothetical protein
VSDSWKSFLSNVERTIDDLRSQGCPIPFFRGHSNSAWTLTPSLGRKRYNARLENWLYYDFLSYGGPLLPTNHDSWDILFLIRHHKLSTRLLDWSETFAVALYFAIEGSESETAIWVLNPYALNQRYEHGFVIKNPRIDYPDHYWDYFISKSASFSQEVAAISPPRTTRRIAAQAAVFTLHRNLRRGLEALAPECVTKIVLPRRAISQARRFLRLSGVTEYSLFPDLDGLARHLIKTRIEGLPRDY